MFSTDSRQATRSRDYYSPDITISAISLDWQRERTAVSWTVSAVLGDRSSLMFVAPADVPDAIDPVTQMYVPRTVDIDDYRSFTTEPKACIGTPGVAGALNTVVPSGNGAVGLVPSYALVDLSASVPISEAVQLRLSANNLTDEQYFTKRPEFYPGPGIWSSDGRTYNVSLEYSFAR